MMVLYIILVCTFLTLTSCCYQHFKVKCKVCHELSEIRALLKSVLPRDNNYKFQRLPVNNSTTTTSTTPSPTIPRNDVDTVNEVGYKIASLHDCSEGALSAEEILAIDSTSLLNRGYEIVNFMRHHRTCELYIPYGLRRCGALRYNNRFVCRN